MFLTFPLCWLQPQQWPGGNQLHPLQVPARGRGRLRRRQGLEEARAGHRRARPVRAGTDEGGHSLSVLDGEQDGAAAAVQGGRHPPQTPAGLRHAAAVLLQAALLPEEQQGTEGR